MAAELVVTNLRGAIIAPVALTVGSGNCATIGGPSGAGKSLLLRMIADLDPNEGEVRLGDICRSRISAPDWRRHVGYVPAESGWWAETAALHFSADTSGKAMDMAVRLGLDPEAFGRPVVTLSTGERQRLALVRALLLRPKALLLDEPTSALDAASKASVEDLLHETLAAGMILVLVTHDPEQARRLGTAGYVMDAGRLTPA